MTRDDLSLYEAMRSDDPKQVNAATRQLTRRVQTLAMRFVPRNSGSEVDAEDIVQETVLAVWRQMRSGVFQPQPDVPLNAYLNKIVKNKWLKSLQKQPKPLAALEENWADEAPPEHHQTDRLQRAFDQLGTACQQLLRLFYWEGFRMDEIAEQLASSAETIKMRKYRCMIRLGTLLQKNEQID